MNLFEANKKKILEKASPLSTRIRPRNLEEYVGQSHLTKPGTILRNAIEQDNVPSMILWGPAGVGKTTLAKIISNTTQSFFVQLSAVTSGVKEVRKIIDESEYRLGELSQRTILFIDEIHRFSKSQQDALLSGVEEGIVTLVGATTENPSFTIINPLLSRTRTFTLNLLSETELYRVIDRALHDRVRGMGNFEVDMDNTTKKHLAKMSNGDARILLNTLEFATINNRNNSNSNITISEINDALERTTKYDRSGDAHYDSISAFIKSIRSSDPDAAIYYLARMINAGEDPLFIARRLVISSAEDIGLANPNALAVAIAAQQAVSFIGMPEGRIPLAEATIFLASCPKSNSAYNAINKAMEFVGSNQDFDIPKHLKNAPNDFMKKLGNSEGYKYSHNYPGNFIQTTNLPKKISNHRFYVPGTLGSEKQINKRLNTLWENKYEN